MDRREFLASTAVVATLWPTVSDGRTAATVSGKAQNMYGLIGKMTATPGQRDALIAILLEGTTAMPGCLSYIVATDPSNADAIWITEAWDTKASHDASLTLPEVQAAIKKGKPLIADFSNGVTTTPVGGYGLGAQSAPALGPRR